MPVGPALFSYSGTPMGTLVTGCPNPFAYLCVHKSIWAQNRILQCQVVRKAAGVPECQSVYSVTVLRLKPRNCTETNSLWFGADEAFEKLACAFFSMPLGYHMLMTG